MRKLGGLAHKLLLARCRSWDLDTLVALLISLCWLVLSLSVVCVHRRSICVWSKSSLYNFSCRCSSLFVATESRTDVTNWYRSGCGRGRPTLWQSKYSHYSRREQNWSKKQWVLTPTTFWDVNQPNTTSVMVTINSVECTTTSNLKLPSGVLTWSVELSLQIIIKTKLNDEVKLR